MSYKPDQNFRRVVLVVVGSVFAQKNIAGLSWEATAKDPQERYRSTDDALQDLLLLADRMGMGNEPEAKPRRNMMSLFMFYDKDRQREINRLVEDFTEGLKDLGAELRLADFQDV